MAKFMYLYRGPATDMAAMSPEQSKAIMDQWGAWAGKVGGALTDFGAPFGATDSVLDNGKGGKAADMTGYSIVEAADLGAAKKMTEGHPFLTEGKGRFAIDVFELVPLPM